MRVEHDHVGVRVLVQVRVVNELNANGVVLLAAMQCDHEPTGLPGGAGGRHLAAAWLIVVVFWRIAVGVAGVAAAHFGRGGRWGNMVLVAGYLA